jgi:catechol 2,3-dioxygenase
LATDADARLLEWELILPDASSVNGAAESLAGHGFVVERSRSDAVARDPWGTQLRIVVAR